MNPDVVDIMGFPGYRIDREGGSWSCRIPKSGKLGSRWKRLKGTVDSTGYLSIHLRRDGKTIKKNLHVLVLEAFVGPRPPGMQACHKDGNRTNCRLDNLRWDTPSGNEADKILHGTSNRGSRQGRSKLRESDIPEIFAVRREIPEATMEEIGILFGVAKTTIQGVLEGRNWGWLKAGQPSLSEGS
jgi:hypothetical protein